MKRAAKQEVRAKSSSSRGASGESKALVPARLSGGLDPQSALLVAILSDYVERHPSMAKFSKQKKKQCTSLLLSQLTGSAGVQAAYNAMSDGQAAQLLQSLDSLVWANIDAVENKRPMSVMKFGLEGNPLTPLSASKTVQPLPIFSDVQRHPIFTSARYNSEFEPISLVGRGGFGRVVSCKGKIDNQVYAIKIIPITASMLKRFADKSPEDMRNKVFKEVRALAGLDHENIVRYYGTWIEEWGDHLFLPGGQDDDDDDEEDTDDPQDSSPVSPLRRQSHAVSFDDSFEANRFETLTDEASNEKRSKEGEDDGAWESAEEEGEGDEEDDVSNSVILSPAAERFTEGSDIFDRGYFSNASVDLPVKQPPLNKGPVYGLFLQMSYHPFSLAEFLLPAMATRTAALPEGGSLRHSFHPIPTIAIILKIIDAVVYMHEQGMVHRDIKPANIMLQRSPRPIRGGIAIGGCYCYRDLDDESFVCQDDYCRPKMECWITPKICDFGLVADLKHTLDTSAGGGGGNPVKNGASANAGTTFYKYFENAPNIKRKQYFTANIYNVIRPPVMSKTAAPAGPCPKSDVYALGITLFESLYRMDTASERFRVLSDLVDSNSIPERLHDMKGEELDFPNEFPSCPVPEWYEEELKLCIGNIIHPDKEKRWDLQTTRDALSRFLMQHQDQ